MRPRFLIRLGAIVGIAVLGCMIIVMGPVRLRDWLAVPNECRTPCSLDLGSKRLPGEETDEPNCQPADFRLELYRPKAKAGIRYPLWYRATLRNNTCFTLSEVLVHDLVSGPEFRVWNANGVKVERKVLRELGKVEPYGPSPGAFQVLKSDPELHFHAYFGPPGFESRYIELPPGRSVTTLPVVIAPQMNWLQPHGAHLDLSAQNPEMRGIIAHGAKGAAFETPPNGFAPVDGFIFRKLGKYRIQVVFDASFQQSLIYPRFTWYRTHVPAVIRSAIGRLAVFFHNTRIEPPEDRGTTYRLHVESNPIEFEVVP